MELETPLHYVKAWRELRGYSLANLADKAGLPMEELQALETEAHDLPLSLLHRLGAALDIPAAWLLAPPALVQLLDDEDEPQSARFSNRSAPSTMEHVLKGIQKREDLHILLSALIQHGDAKLIRAAEVNLRSLLKHARTVAVPWQSRPSGHFEPPSD